MNKAFYVTNTSVEAAFRYAHPRWHNQPITLYVFDYCPNSSGRVLVYDNWQGGRPQKPTRTQPISTYATLTDFYNNIIAIGESEPGTVTELHFFTHGDPSCGIVLGPWSECTKTEFDRVLGKGTKRGDNFSKAFQPGALIKLWGCASGVDGPKVKQLTLGYWKTDSKTRRRAIQQRVESYIRGMYAWRLSFLLDQTVWATPYGWSSAMGLPPRAAYFDYWDVEFGPRSDSMWWRVSPLFVAGRGAKFYREVLKTKIDPVGYVAINDAMSKAPEPAEFIKVEVDTDDLDGGSEAYPT
ncbi:MAG: hypothetical protein BroJett021_25990 [Chloroflexota bacterium]|nr:hypothetical protein [Caldilinea sp.]GIK73611.1 MAG: hypothetical protein BroJett021_25990 [Chloroflexota bacterium]